MKLRALITGSTSGIGLGLAQAFAESGMAILMHGLELEGKEIAESISRRWNVEVYHSTSDLSTRTGCEALAKQAESCLGQVDVLVNNAGVQYVAPVDDFPTEKWDLIMSVNLTAPFLLARALWPGMKAQGFGRIINLASVHG